MDDKETLHRYLRGQRADLLGKLDGLSDYDVRRPLTGTGTNLLGLVKHVATVQLGYLGEVFGRPSERSLPWEDAEPDADMWVTADQTRQQIIDLHHYSAAHADATVEALALDAPGLVPWWSPERRAVTLHQILVHLCVDTARHAGHADILREHLDGVAGGRPGDPNITSRSAGEWAAYRARIEAAAVQAGSAPPAT
ncbi:DinB family protein [Cellulomonas sp. P22]|uniref:DinB family protein n=1 Tax=Cellulomonas sp. P22 TaxID=3373189 RepID=UPI0037BC5E5A